MRRELRQSLVDYIVMVKTSDGKAGLTDTLHIYHEINAMTDRQLKQEFINVSDEEFRSGQKLHRESIEGSIDRTSQNEERRIETDVSSVQ